MSRRVGRKELRELGPNFNSDISGPQQRRVTRLQSRYAPDNLNQSEDTEAASETYATSNLDSPHSKTAPQPLLPINPKTSPHQQPRTPSPTKQLVAGTPGRFPISPSTSPNQASFAVDELVRTIRRSVQQLRIRSDTHPHTQQTIDSFEASANRLERRGNRVTAVMATVAPNPGQEAPGPYSRNQYRRDAMVIQILEERIRDNRVPNVPFTLSVSFSASVTAEAVIKRHPRAADTMRRQAIEHIARLFRNEEEMPQERWTQFLKLFLDGTDDDDDEEEADSRRASQASFHAHSATTENVARDFTPGRHLNNSTLGRRPTMSNPGRFQLPPDHLIPGSAAYHEFMATTHRQREFFSTRNGYVREQPSGGPTNGAPTGTDMIGLVHPYQGRDRKLRTDDIGEYDGTTSVKTFCRRLAQRVNEYTEYRVLEVLPTCVRDAALRWYESLPEMVHERMMSSVHEWIVQLEFRFAKNPLDAEDQARRCKHSFANLALPLREYVTVKRTLLQEAGVKHSYDLIQRIWRDLDPVLMQAVRIIPGMTEEEFTSTLYVQEFAARELHRQLHRPAPNSRRTDAPSVPSANERGRLPAGNTKATDKLLEAPPKRRQKYPCKHCGSMEHINPNCPTLQANFAAETDQHEPSDSYEDVESRSDPESGEDLNI